MPEGLEAEGLCALWVISYVSYAPMNLYTNA